MNEKPISIALYDLKQDLIKIINESQIHICLVELVLKDLHREVEEASQQILKKDLIKYNQQDKEEKE